MHINRQNIGKFWPVPRKGTKYLAFASHNQKHSIPLVVVLRDILGLVKNKKELKKAINENRIKMNGKEIKEVNYPVGLFDIFSVGEKSFKTSLNEHKKFTFEEVTGKDAENKIVKISGKKVLGKDKIQINLTDGRNLLINDKVDVGNSVVYNFKDKKVEKIIKMEKGKTGFVVSGKHAGRKGKIDEIIHRGGKSLAKIIVREGSEEEKGKKINVWIRNVVVIE